MPKLNKGPRLELNTRGVWEVRWTESGRSRRVSTRSQDRNEASRFLAGFIVEVERQGNQDVTIGDVLRAYLAEHVDAGHVTAKDRQHCAAANMMPFFGDMLPDQITQGQVSKYCDLRRVGKVGSRRAPSSATHRRELNMLVAAISHAVKNKRITAADVPYIPLPRGSAPRDVWLTEQEAEQFIAAAREHGSVRGCLFIVIALNTASRRRAIETLTWDQVDFGARLIHFNPPGRIQSAKRRVAVPMSDELLTELQRVPTSDRFGFVLGHDKGIVRAFEVVCRAAAKKHKNPKFLQINRHTLRHTWATLAARAGVPLFEIAGVLGDSMATVQKNYLHHAPDHLRGAVNFRGKAA